MTTFERSPVLVRVVPLLIFVGLTFLQGKLGATSPYWVYALKTVAGAGLLLLARPLIPEMKWKLSWEGAVVGIAVFVVWIGINDWYPKLTTGHSTWNPHVQFGQGTAAAWLFIVIRILGSTLVVPPLEEVFYRSFLYRYIAKPDFQSVPLGQFHWTSFLVTSAVFGLSHYEWLAGILCAFAYQGLVCWKKRLGDAMTAHAITNLLLGLWVVRKGAWNFW